MMSQLNERQSTFGWTVSLFRQAISNSNVGWILRQMFSRCERPLSAEDIISRMSGSNPSTTTKIPDGFMEKFTFLPRVPMDHMLKMLGYADICRLQRVSGPFAEFFTGNSRKLYAMNELVHGHIKLEGTNRVSITRFNKTLIINHDQLSKSLRTTRIRNMMIVQTGTLRADSFHIPELTCSKLDIRLYDALDETAVIELIRVLEQIAIHLHITSLTLIARTNDDCAALRNRLVEITNRSANLIQQQTVISVIPP
uniref:F-box domain-containing protein n=1 Tax=Caenorhabditis tropicalis TaxID=1561998 RepID=A0A1I7V0G5_9PELO